MLSFLRHAPLAAAVLLLPSIPLAAAPPSPVTATIAISDASIRTVSENFFGTNFVALWNPNGGNTAATYAYSQMGLKLLRFPGGVPAEWYDWQTPLESGWTNITPDIAWKMAKSSGGQMIFQTNAATDKTDTDKKTGKQFTFSSDATHQAAWVKYAKAQRIKVAFWEIGNEPEMDAPAAAKGDDGRVYKWYNAKFEEQAKAIKAVDPNAKVMGPAATNEYFWWAQHNLDKFLAAEGNKQGTGLVDAISLHYYPEAGDASKWPTKRGTAQEWIKRMDYIRQTIAKYDSRDLPVYITEWNFAAGDKNTSAEALATALGNADMIGMFLRTGVAGHTHFCYQHVDHGWGVLGSADEKWPENTPTPTYFALTMASVMGSTVLSTTNSADEANVLSAYATRSTDGAVQILLINKSRKEQTAALSFTLKNFKPAGRTARCYTLQGDEADFTDTQVIYNGITAPNPAKELPGPASIKLTEDTVYQQLEPYSIAVLVIPK